MKPDFLERTMSAESPHTNPAQADRPVVSRRAVLAKAAAPALLTVCSGSAFATASHMRCLVNAQTTTPAATWGTTGGPDAWVRVRLVEITTTTRTGPPPNSGGQDKVVSAGDVPAGNKTSDGMAQAQPKTGSTLPIPDASSTAPLAAGGAIQPNSGTGGPLFPTVTRYYIRGSDLKDETGRPYRICPSAGSPVPADGKWLEIDVRTFTAVVDPVGSYAPPAAASTAAPSNHWVIVRFDKDGCITGIGMGSPGAIIGQSCWASAGPLIARAL
jgi:hypothetical protein